MQGKVTQLEGMLSASASYKSQRMFDIQLGSLDARLTSQGPGTVSIDMKATIFTKTEQLKGSFEQKLTQQGN